jgi:hypothetical protein
MGTVALTPPRNDVSPQSQVVSDTLTDDHHDWVQSTFGVDPRGSSSDATDAPAEAAPADDAPTATDEAPADTETAAAEPAPADDASANSETAPADDESVASEPAPSDDSAATTEASPSDDTSANGEATSPDDAPTATQPAPADDAAATSEGAPAESSDELSGGVFDTAAKLFDRAKDVVSSTADDVVKGVTKIVDETRETVDNAIDTVEQGIVDTAKTVVDKVGAAARYVEGAITGQEPLPPDLPQSRADDKLSSLSDDDRKKVQTLLDGADSDEERRYLTKALASGHTPEELQAFAERIKGKDADWQRDHLHLVGDSTGHGVKQQWSYSCGPTTVQAIKGELDPIYALQVNEQNVDVSAADNTDPEMINPTLADDQKRMLVDGGGVATSRDDPDGTGQGLIFKNLLNKQTGSTGLVYDAKRLGKDVTVDDALNTMSDGVKKGVPVPITVGDTAHPYAHAALVTAVDDGPPRTFTIHDPWEGRTDTFTEDQIKNDQVNVGGWKHVGVVFPPSVKH